MVFWSIIITIVALGVMVTLHEAGHFAVAKAFGVLVHEFSVGMGPKITSKRRGETEYSLRAIPLGGYVRLEGEGEESDDPRSFSRLAPIRKILILVAGAVMNILLGFLIFTVIYANIPKYVDSPDIYQVTEGAPAHEAGIRSGDRVESVNGIAVSSGEDFRAVLAENGPKPVEIAVIRDGEHLDFTVTPFLEDDRWIVGVYFGYETRYTLPEMLENARGDTVFVAKAVVSALGGLFNGKYAISDLSGPVGVVSVVNDVATKSPNALLAVLYLFAMISVNLGIFNLLPIPGLDGGQIIFALCEAVTRKKLKSEILGYINAAGLALLLILAIAVMISDIGKLF